jgi:predicted permease
MSAADLIGDARHALRMFRKNPGFSLAAIAALTLGIGANTAIFSIVNAVLLRPLSFVEPDRLVLLQTRGPGGAGAAASPAKFAHWRRQTDTLQLVSAFRSNVMNLTGGGPPEQLRVSQVSSDYFALFGVRPAAGRFFGVEEDRPDGPRVVVLSETFWSRRYDRAATAIGSTISLGGQTYVITGIGIVPPGLDEIGPMPDVWVPFQLDPNSADQGHYFQAAGRLLPGVSIERARAALEASTAGYRQTFPNALQNNASFTLERFREVVVTGVRPTLLILGGAVGLVLLIACANVANLLLVRATGRRREVALRAAVGASRGRIVGQLLTESLLLAATGGVLGVLAGFAGMRALLAINTAGLPRVGEAGVVVTLDWRVLVFALAVTVLTAVLFGLVPAVQASRADLGAVLKEGGGRSATGTRQNAARAVLVVAEIALALVLVVGSALLIRTAVALGRVDPGFDASRVLTMRMSLNDQRFMTSESVERIVQSGIERLRALPGVVNASATCCVPLEGGYGLPYVVVGRPLTDGPFHGGGAWLTVSPGYFEVFDIAVRQGRTFTERDDTQGPAVVVINEAMVREAFRDANPLEHRLVIGRGVMREFADEPDRQIIGVVADVRDGGLNNDPGPHMYIPQAQVRDAVNALNVTITPTAWVVRTAGAPMALAQPVEEALRQATGLPVSNVRSMDEVVSRSTSRQRFNMWLMSVFGASALLLAAIGIYGVMAYSVEQRTQEIGIRLALGAEVRAVRRMVIWQGLRLALAGVAIGIVAALAVARVLTTLLFGVEPRDPAAFVTVSLLLLAVAVLAVWVPAARASRVNPIHALRCD